MSTRKTHPCAKSAGRPRGTYPEDLKTPLQKSLYDYFVTHGTDERWALVERTHGITRSTIDRWISGTEPKYDKLRALAAVTGVPASEWLRDKQAETATQAEAPPASHETGQPADGRHLSERRLQLLRLICQLPRRAAELHEQILECDEDRLSELEDMAKELQAALRQVPRASSTG